MQWFSPATTSKHRGSPKVTHNQSHPSPKTPVRSLPGKAGREEPALTALSSARVPRQGAEASCPVEGGTAAVN